MEDRTTAGQPTKEVEVNDDISLQRAVDQVSLEQALRDFDVANVRVIDLTRRLVASEREIVALQRQVDESALALRDLQAVHTAMQTSAAFRIASKIWNLRNALRG
jgi:hypothetical protein